MIATSISLVSILSVFLFAQEIPAHDPSNMVNNGNYLEIYASGSDGNGLKYFYYDLTNHTWNTGITVFPNGQQPDWYQDIQIWNDSGEFDAPTNPFPDVLYYTVFDEGPSGLRDAIGRTVAVGEAPNRQWIDDGIVVRSYGEANHPRAMDPFVFLDGDELWMAFGSSVGGIYLVQLDQETGKLLEHPEDIWCSPGETDYPDRFINIAKPAENEMWDSWMEAPYLYKHGNYYYLFLNRDNCCDGEDSSYNIRVGRSFSLQGPYVDHQNIPMLEGGGKVLMDSEGEIIGNSDFQGPGHAGIIEVNGHYAFTFHYYNDSSEHEALLGIRELIWDDDGWPVVTNNAIDYNWFQTNQTLGYVNEDGLVNIQDVILTVQMVLNDQYDTLADLNNDSAVNVSDIILIVNIILNPTSSYPENVLFIGNSYTASNGGIHNHLDQFVESAFPDFNFFTTGQTVGGSTLQLHFNTASTIDLIQDGNWDSVVLQEQSTRPIDNPNLFYQYAEYLDEIITESGAETMFFMTWAREYNPEMIEGLAEAYNNIGDQLNADVCPVGRAFEKAIDENPHIDLYTGDGSHPNAFGTYLAICMFYACMFEENPVGTEYISSPAISEQEKNYLQMIAWETLIEYGM